ncbi:GAF domain-containing protein [Paracoccus sediminis]|uniref:GAF domain-containing protein n=1 Tax=Paracoccus sediminis TaxID=1214787 RepID=A0A238USQ5_9RHOB|nr:GAF domain-containing protein [Paracoccus sediminis]TBN52893.1 GAF domain-containing protein [Paracoccus sediminis]SNR24727.1 GAF domain-containing protein [Paracoccus sediminis]
MTARTPALSAAAANPAHHAAIQNSLDTVRETLGMEVAYLSEFVDSRAVFRAVSAPGLEAMIQPSQSMDIREVYCKHIIDGNLPRLMPDTSVHKIATDLPITQMIPIGSHLSVPVHRPDGSVFGMFCFLSRHPRPDLNDDALDLVETHCAMVTNRLDSIGSQAA